MSKIAKLRGVERPRAEQELKILEFVRKKYSDDYELEWEYDNNIELGFVLQVDSDIYDWSLIGKVNQFRDLLHEVPLCEENYMSLVKETVKNWQPIASSREEGIVEEIGDGIAIISGLQHVNYGEIIIFENGQKALVQDIQKDTVGCMIFGKDDAIVEGDKVFRTGKTAGIPVSDAIIGRVVDALGEPIDGKGDITAEAYYPIERPAPEILDRAPV